MKQQLLFIAMLCLAFSLQAQEQDEKKKGKKENLGTHNHFEIDLGTNNFFENGKFPDDNNERYAVRPFGSWYAALKSINDTHIAGPLHVLWGLDVSWYNFKFQNESVRLAKTNDQVEFMEAPLDLESTKSKLTVAYLNSSFVPMLKFGEGRHHHRHNWMGWNDWHDKRGFRIGAGGYAGYKIGSYAKYVTEKRGNKQKDKDKDGFYLNNLRYGLRMQAGFRGMDVFVNYDLNELFVAGKGPELHAFSFGIVL